MLSGSPLDDLDAALAAHGLSPRGGFSFGAGEIAPAGPSGAPAKSVLLIGHMGGAMWPHFAAWRKRQTADLADPLDTWSKQVIGGIAAQIGAWAVFPSDPPYMPFQQWAMRAEGLRPSPLGILMHPDAGLWHAYRAALLFDVDILSKAPLQKLSHVCDTCLAKPCLSACPVEAFTDAGFDVATCRSHVRSEAGQRCREAGCMARNACQVGADHRYPMEQQAFHQRAFLG